MQEKGEITVLRWGLTKNTNLPIVVMMLGKRGGLIVFVAVCTFCKYDVNSVHFIAVSFTSWIQKIPLYDCLFFDPLMAQPHDGNLRQKINIADDDWDDYYKYN